MTERKFTYRPDPHDERDYRFRAAPVDLPHRVDLRNERMPPIWDQGSLGSCTAFATLALREYIFATNAVQGGLPFRLSPLYLYYYSRDQIDETDRDDGAYLRDVFKVLRSRGVCPELNWPYYPGRVSEHPSTYSDAAAYAFTISEYHRVANLAELRAAIAADQPVVFGMQIYLSFTNVPGGHVPIPDPTKDIPLGGHAMLAVGYDDDEQYVIVRNSWGEDWGDGGYGYIPYALFAWPHVSDMWTCRADPAD